MLNELIKRLEAVAKKNGDRFQYSIEIQPRRGGGIEFQFTCIESYDHHVLFTGSGESIEEAVRKADEESNEALNEWGYEL